MNKPYKSFGLVEDTIGVNAVNTVPCNPAFYSPDHGGSEWGEGQRVKETKY